MKYVYCGIYDGRKEDVERAKKIYLDLYVDEDGDSTLHCVDENGKHVDGSRILYLRNGKLWRMVTISKDIVTALDLSLDNCNRIEIAV